MSGEFEEVDSSSRIEPGLPLFPSPIMWLDFLLPEVIDSIAKHVTHGVAGLATAHFASTSERFCEAVRNALKSPMLLEFPMDMDGDTESDGSFEDEESENDPGVLLECVQALGDFPLHLKSRTLTRFVEDVLRIGNVVECAIGYNWQLFCAVSEKLSVRLLDMELCAETNIKETFRRISKMNLVELRFQGRVYCGKGLKDFVKGCNDIVSACPSLRVISLESLFVTLAGHNDLPRHIREHLRLQEFYKALAKLPDCCEVSVRKNPPGRIIPLFQKFHAVRVYVGVSRVVAGRIGDGVRFYWEDSARGTFPQVFEPWTLRFPDDLDQLRKCRGMTDLRLHLNTRLCRDLPALLFHLQNIRKLDLRLAVEEPASPPGALLRIVQFAPNLSNLCVANVFVSPSEWKEVLEQLGSKLRYLAVYRSIFKAKASSDFIYLELERIETQLSSIPRFNPNLECFSPTNLFIDPDALTAKRKPSVEKIRRAIYAWAAKVQCAMPYLNAGSLFHTIVWAIGDYPN